MNEKQDYDRFEKLLEDYFEASMPELYDDDELEVVIEEIWDGFEEKAPEMPFEELEKMLPQLFPKLIEQMKGKVDAEGNLQEPEDANAKMQALKGLGGQ